MTIPVGQLLSIWNIIINGIILLFYTVFNGFIQIIRGDNYTPGLSGLWGLGGPPSTLLDHLKKVILK